MDKVLRLLTTNKTRFHSLLMLLLIVFYGCAEKEPWFIESSKVIIDTPSAKEIKQYWTVEGKESLSLSETLLKDVSARELTMAEAENILGLKPVIPDSLYLVRAIKVQRKPKPIRVYFASGEVQDRYDENGKVTFTKSNFKYGVIQVVAGTNSTCMIFPPGVVKQPLILSLEALPERVTMFYQCSAP